MHASTCLAFACAELYALPECAKLTVLHPLPACSVGKVSDCTHGPYMWSFHVQVMANLMQQLGVPIPAYIRTDKLLLSHKLLSGPQPTNSTSSSPEMQPQQQDGSSWGFSFSVASVHGEDCPLPMVASARVSFYDQAAFAARAAQLGPSQQPAAAGTMDPAATAAAPEQPPHVDVQGLQEVLPAQEVSGQVPWRVERSCPAGLQAVAVVVDLQLVDAADADNRQQQVEALFVCTRPPHTHHTCRFCCCASAVPHATAMCQDTPSCGSEAKRRLVDSHITACGLPGCCRASH
jgi:hypothetical protein